jgi:hypothetical protein
MIRVSRCVFCNSTAYGKGCRFGPKGHHFHPDDPKKCSWCGSTSFGIGCKLNPNGNTHVHGIDYNPMLKETLKNNFLLKELNRPITEFAAYKLKIIDDNGSKIKEPISEEEKYSYTPAVQTILKIKKYLGSKIDLINHSMVLEKESKMQYNKKNHLKLLALEQKISDIYEDLSRTIDTALTDGLALEQISAILQK